MKIIKGNLVQLALEGRFDVIIHGCNCFCTMGKGIAKTIKEVFPEAYEADKRTLKGDIDKLGGYSFVTYSSENSSESKKKLTIINAYIQYDYNSVGEKSIKLNYDALEEVMKIIKNRYSGERIAYPKIGAGLACGDWDKISKIINKTLEGEDHTFVEYDGSQIKWHYLKDRIQILLN